MDLPTDTKHHSIYPTVLYINVQIKDPNILLVQSNISVRSTSPITPVSILSYSELTVL